jgi:RHS repeat-associated protein
MSAPGEFSLNLGDLKPHTIYYYRAAADGGEATVWGDINSFATLYEGEMPVEETSPETASSSDPEATPENTPEITPSPEKTPEPEVSPAFTPPAGSEYDPDEEDHNKEPRSNKVTQRIKPDADSVIQSASKRIKLDIPQGAVSEELEVEIAELRPDNTSEGRMIKLFELNASNLSREKVSSFNKTLTISICHANEDIGAVNPFSLRLYYRDEDKGEWVLLPDSSYDMKTNTVTATTNHFSQYAEVGTSLESGPGRVMAAQVGLFSGAATFSYPIELPPGPGGFTPRLELNYNSASVDEMKNELFGGYQVDVGSWVGTGWSLGFGSISTNLDTRQYYLDLNGSSCEIVSDGNNSYHTLPEQHFKITRNDNTWEMYDREGVYYRFGGSASSDSVQITYTTKGFETYRWDLNLIRDTNGNEATISYQRVGGLEYGIYMTRTAHPQYLRYNNNLVEVAFTWSYDDEDHDVRYDNPIPAMGYPASFIMEIRRLDTIEIRISGKLIRKYAFTYNDLTDPDYERVGTQTAGKFKLKGLTQYGADGTTALPSLTFEYENKTIYRKWDDDRSGSVDDYEVFDNNWPYLTKVFSGYGGEISFEYTEKPNNHITEQNTWSREVVTKKTTTPGIGPEQDVFYAYIGDPVYLGEEKNMQFRGFEQVTEKNKNDTEIPDYYVKHYYYTTGFVNGLDYERLSGREYCTQWYDNANTLLRETNYTYSINPATLINEGIKLGTIAGEKDPLEVTMGLSTSPIGVLYAADYVHNCIHEYTATGYELGTIENAHYVTDLAVSADDTLFFIECHNTETYYKKIIKHGAGSTHYNFGSLIYPYGITVSNNGYVFVSVWDTNDDDTYYIARLTTDLVVSGETFGLGYLNKPKGIAASYDGYIYVASYGDGKVVKFSDGGNWQLDITDASLVHPWGIAVSDDGFIYVGDVTTDKIIKFSPGGTKMAEYSCDGGKGLAFSPLYNYLYVSSTESDIWGINMYSTHYLNWTINLDQVDETTYDISGGGSKSTRVRYIYDDYGNVVMEYRDGDTSISADDSTLWRSFNPNTTAHILSKPARERLYSGIVESDEGGTNVKSQTDYFYDNNAWADPPDNGNLTKVRRYSDQNTYIESTFAYDTYGNKTSETDPNSNTTTWAYESIYHTYPVTKTFPAVNGVQFQESCTYDPGTHNLLTQTDINGTLTYYNYDTFKRFTSTMMAAGNGTFGLDQGNITLSPSGNHIYLSRFQNSFGDGTLTKLQIKINDSTPTGKVRLGMYAGDAVGSVGSLLIDAGEIDVANGWIGIDNLHAEVESGSYYWLAFVMSANNSADGIVNYQQNTFATRYLSYGPLPQTLNGIGTNSGSYVMRAFVSGPGAYGSVKYRYNNWGTIGSQNIKTITRVDANNTLWQAQYFDGLGRVVQTQAQGESGHTVITGTTAYGDRGLVDKQYVSQDIASVLSAYYDTGIGNWKYTTYAYDALGRVTQQTNADSSAVSTDYSSAWQTTVTDQRNAQNTFVYDAFNRLAEVKNLASNICSGWNSPTAYSSATATSPANAYLSDDAYAYATAAGKNAIYSNFNIPVIPSGATINGIQVGVEGYQLSTANSFDVYLSFDGGTSYTALQNTGAMGTTETTKYVGGTTDTWGRTWSAGDFTNTNFMIKIVWKLSNRLNLDCLTVRVFYAGGEQTSTRYTYDVLGNLTDVYDNNNNHTGMTYNMLSRKTAMSDPDMGSWSYQYDSNGNLTTQTDAKSQTISMVYDGLNRLSSKIYPAGSGTTNVYYNYDSTFGLSKSNSSQSESLNRISLMRFKNTDGTGTLTALSLKFSQSSASGNVRLGVYADNNGAVGSRLLDAGAIACGTGWVTISGLSLAVTQNTYYWLAFTMSGTNTLEYQDNFGTNTLAAKSFTYAALPSTLSGLTYSNNAFVYKATVSNGNYGKGMKTSMSDASGSSNYKFDIKGRLTTENKTIDSALYNTAYTYDGADRPVTITYPTEEVVTHGYNVRGLPYTLTGSTAGTLVTGATYNALGMMKELKMGSATPLLKTTCNYYGTGGSNDTPGGYYGRLWEIKTVHSSTTLQDVKHTWDAAGNLTQRQFQSGTQETEDFVYDYLDRLTSVSGAYSESFSYDTLGNITSKTTGGTTRNYTYGSSKPHAVTSISNPTTSYSYDDNGNMLVGTARTWDVENRLTSITKDSITTNYVYDGYGSRVKKTVGGVATIYVNPYYEKTGNTETTYYYLGGKLVAQRQGISPNFTLSYLMQDHLGSTSVTYTPSVPSVNSIRYYSFGAERLTSGTLPTDIKFTGQRLDATGLYYYGARYYDAEIGRFISPDTIVPHPMNPQSLNRYSYCLNNPLRYIDPTGHGEGEDDDDDDESTPPEDYEKYLEYLKRGGDCSYAHWHKGQVFVNTLINDFNEAIASMGCQQITSSPDETESGWGSWEYWKDNLLNFPSKTKQYFVDMINGYSNLAQTSDGRIQLAADGFFIIVTKGENGSATVKASQFMSKWPKTANEMDDLLKVKGNRIPDLPSTPGRNKVIWQISDNLQITYEQHPYHPGAPISHSGTHYHLDYPGNPHAGPYVPGDPLP